MGKELSPDTKFTLSIQTMIGAAMGIASLVGMWYMLQSDIQEAKELPTLESLYESEYPSKPQGYNHPASYEQYKSQVGALQENQDEIYETVEELQEEIEKLKQQVINLRIAVQ
jgi:peptidoglycan hydrolase CwlO-like protein|tara:strand:- start:118 stop:456 length:339 start_codon:yes stop_codon:yes gene_type:complete